MIAVVLKLRWHAQPSRTTSGIAYGLCSRCFKYEDAPDRVEAALTAAAERVVIQ